MTDRYKIALYLMIRNQIIGAEQILPEDIDVIALDVMDAVLNMIDEERGAAILEEAYREKRKGTVLEDASAETAARRSVGTDHPVLMRQVNTEKG